MENKFILPVTILTGFLGAGKTTLLNYLLENNRQEKIAIIENEFGATGIDGALLNVHQNVNIVELNNGCVCCSIRGELTEAFMGILDKIDNGELCVERLILETTGLADPSPIIQTFFLDERIQERIILDAVITLVDCMHGLKQLDENRVVAGQIGFADKIILTKSDLVNSKQKDLVLSRIHAINAKAEIIEALKGAVPKNVWIGINTFDLDDALSLNKGIYQVKPQGLQLKNFSLEKPIQSWNDAIHSYVFEADELNLEKIDLFIESLIEEYGNDMLRYKGVFAISNEPRRLIIQGVHKVVGFDYGTPWETQGHSLLVIIGRYLPYESLKARFLATCAGTQML